MFEKTHLKFINNNRSHSRNNILLTESNHNPLGRELRTKLDHRSKNKYKL